MAYVFVLVFFAAIAGIFKPYIQGLKRLHFAIAAVVAFVLVGITAPSTSNSNSKAKATAPQSPATTAASDASPSPSEASSKWEYSESKDEMRGTTSKLASVTSDNDVNLEFPYGDVHGELWVRRRPEDGLNVAFQVEKGQVLCNSFTESHLSIKFDNGPIQKFRCTGSSDGSTETAFIEDQGRMVADLKKAKRTIIEAEFYQQGRKQFVFETAGLKWQ